MTERQICEHIIRCGWCINISCNGELRSRLNYGTRCPLYNGMYDCDKHLEVEQAQAWLNDHKEVEE